mmetsp:Transcript_32146/g.55521  ORF Transcript_32146/g.55521 Transcript_32146/m.55521 type:complete len:128 (+) Transcript_32146:1536-1919(+)|eukprot:CAMPEP_0204905486 /NCGR_PEP_ID=MMETSP1397-20131031/5445_1 /ASSEMBLY_ACC=CAM_ASM_000891 /TAXON_ID=49980 /ORGANISM="Climacostomum Climacostomum virens, Strain Stock W-24" /LENGTH=127 /DNA_ID=CAMNT_0052074369 /DNA_START=1510 /DNA_END=1893 /DNA_ORIENTATION=-
MEFESDRDADLLLRLEELFTDPNFMSDTEAYLNQHVELFTDAEDQPIECHRVFQHFSTLISTKLDAFVASEGVSEVFVFDTLQKVFEEDSTCLTCFEYIFAACDYKDFLQLMLERKDLLNWSEAEAS